MLPIDERSLEEQNPCVLHFVPTDSKLDKFVSKVTAIGSGLVATGATAFCGASLAAYAPHPILSPAIGLAGVGLGAVMAKTVYNSQTKSMNAKMMKLACKTHHVKVGNAQITEENKECALHKHQVLTQSDKMGATVAALSAGLSTGAPILTTGVGLAGLTFILGVIASSGPMNPSERSAYENNLLALGAGIITTSAVIAGLGALVVGTIAKHTLENKIVEEALKKYRVYTLVT